MLLRQCQTCIQIRTNQLTLRNPDTLKIQVKRIGVVVDIIGNVYHSLVVISVQANQRCPQGIYCPAYLSHVSSEVQIGSMLTFEHFHH